MENTMEKKPYTEPELTAVELDFNEVMTTSPASCQYIYVDEDDGTYLCFD